jgi:hypothetical protein
MRTVFLITGFQNWGKTHLIKDAFDRDRFVFHKLFLCQNRLFCVVPQSNDDLGQEGYERRVRQHIDAVRKTAKEIEYIASAFCPTKEKNNNSLEIIQNLYSEDKVILIPIEYKWCGHAQLRVNEITNTYAGLKNVQVVPVTSKDPKGKLKELITILNAY